MVQDLLVRIAEHQVDGIRGRAIRQALAGKDDAVPGKAGFETAHGPVTPLVPQLGDDIGAGILVEGTFDIRLLFAAGGEVQPVTDLPQAPHFDHAR
jgi:hypothetical protein